MRAAIVRGIFFLLIWAGFEARRTLSRRHRDSPNSSPYPRPTKESRFRGLLENGIIRRDRFNDMRDWREGREFKLRKEGRWNPHFPRHYTLFKDEQRPQYSAHFWPRRRKNLEQVRMSIPAPWRLEHVEEYPDDKSP
eukprot:TRINITY_DN19218_c0_g2_i1.p3 TRINITY_DN19218_c0_g2~~TRINITY_DN19218_c0_g2_i1.p3  ORF type:complete len:137 (-),score=7.65 TRINITY_DN19218_c0_g2_i1:155-565(-)